MSARLSLLLCALCVSSVWGDEIVGYLEPGRSIKISSAEPGIVQQVFVKEGQYVKKGDMLVRLDTRVLEQEVKIAAEEQEMLSRRLEKLRKLIVKKFASEDELNRAESDLRIRELQRQRTEAQIERLTLRSPMDGVITELRFDVAESVPGANSHVVTVVQLDPMRVQFTMPVAEASLLKTGQDIELFFPDSGQKRSGKVDFISPVSTAVVNTVRVKVVVPEPGHDLPAGSKCSLLRSSPSLTSTHP